MSSNLWDSFLRDDVESFQRFLANASYTSGGQRTQGSTPNLKVGSPGTVMVSSPGISAKSKKFGGLSPPTPILDRTSGPRSGKTLSRAELNVRDQHGRTLLHHIASSHKPTAIDFAIALLEIPFLDIYAQDWESGWTALHRALYAGNATIAEALMARDIRDATDFSKPGNTSHPSGSLIKIKDREGYSPFDLYGATIASRDIKRIMYPATAPEPLLAELENSDTSSSVLSHDDDLSEDSHMGRGVLKPRTNLFGDEVFTFGSNKNLNLGLGDQDDRQFPVKITLTRPEHLLQRFYREFQQQRLDDNAPNPHQEPKHKADIPALIKNRPIKVQDIAMSKLHTAILTNDPESNLFMCGFGPGGRLGTGDESTRFSFVCIETGGLAHKKVISVALGQDHSLAITGNGEIFSWGSNKYGQLGYGLPRTSNRDDVPMQTSPRQIFNPFKKEVIIGAAASAIHSVVFSSSGLYTFGKNEGQLGLVDSDARSLEFQTIPRRVGASLFSSAILNVSAIDHATAVLLQNHEVWVFSQYGYSKLSFPLDVSSSFIRNSFMATRYDTSVNRIVKIKSGGNSICALSSFGEVFTVQVNKSDNPPTLSSTTNPSKTRNSLSQPVRVWAVKKAHMAVRDVDVGQDGSIIICTASGSAWTKEKRVKTKDGASKDYKFARVPGLSRVVGVCSNAFGAYAVAQCDCDVTREQINFDESTLWQDFLPLSPFESLRNTAISTNLNIIENGILDFEPVMAIKRAVMSTSDIESHFQSTNTVAPNGTVWITSTLSDVRIPVHVFILTGRSSVLRKAFHDFRQAHFFSMPDVLDIEYAQDGQCYLRFQKVNIFTILNLAFFMYTDGVLDIWHQLRHPTESASGYRQVRTEVMRIAAYLGLPTLERAARLMIEPTKSLRIDMARAINDPSFFESGDVTIELNGETMKAHSQVICQRCPFFDTLFNGRSGGRWLSSRRTNPANSIHVDLKHIDRPIFEFVLRYMYTDTEEQLFDDVRSKDLNEFINLVLDVAFVANELMIDRLAQICQKMLGRFVNTYNVCDLLNSISPCSVTEFKDAALEYICLNLEDMIANRLLQDLDDNLLCALDSVCHDNQLASFPVSRGRNSEAYIFEKYPELVSSMESDKRRKIDSMKLRSRLNLIESNEGRPRAMNNDKTPVSPSVQKAKASPVKDIPSMSLSPVLKSRQSASDLMFQMDDDPLLSPGDAMKGKAAIRGARANNLNYTRPPSESPALRATLVDKESFGDRSYLDDHTPPPRDSILAQSPTELRAAALNQKKNGYPSPSSSQVPWGSSVVSNSKKDLKDIMAEASETGVSNFSLGELARRESSSNFTTKLSQKERKKLQQQQMHEKAVEQITKEAPQNPWKLSTPTKAPSKPEPFINANGQGSASVESMQPNQKPSMTLRQTVAGIPPPRSTPVQVQRRSVSAKAPPTAWPTPSGSSSAAPSASPNPSINAKPAIQSIRHIPRPEPYQTSFHSPSPNSLSLATILLQQQTEKNELREAATAKHNLEDIQLEQEFQEWWNKESRRIQGLPDPESTTTPPRQEAKEGRGGRGGRGQGPRKKRGKGPANAADVSALTQQLSLHNLDGQRGHQQQAPNGNHVPAGGGHTRRGGRGGNRGRGKQRDTNA